MPPREGLTRYPRGPISSSSGRSISPRVSSVSGQATTTKSDSASSRGSSPARRPTDERAPHPERAGEPVHLACDVPVADRADRSAVEQLRHEIVVALRVAVPLVPPQVAVELHEPVRERQHRAEHPLADRDLVLVDVAEGAAGGNRRAVDPIGACGERLDESQPSGPRELLGREAVAQHRVGVRDRVDERQVRYARPHDLQAVTLDVRVDEHVHRAPPDMIPGKSSIKLSARKPIKAGDPAMTSATTAAASPRTCHAFPPHASAGHGWPGPAEGSASRREEGFRTPHRKGTTPTFWGTRRPAPSGVRWGTGS